GTSNIRRHSSAPGPWMDWPPSPKKTKTCARSSASISDASSGPTVRPFRRARKQSGGASASVDSRPSIGPGARVSQAVSLSPPRLRGPALTVGEARVIRQFRRFTCAPFRLLSRRLVPEVNENDSHTHPAADLFCRRHRPDRRLRPPATLAPGRKSPEAPRFHVDRAPRRHRDHRDPDRPASARRAKGPRSGAADAVPELPETGGTDLHGARFLLQEIRRLPLGRRRPASSGVHAEERAPRSGRERPRL